MYRIKNIALQKPLEKYKVKSLEQLNDDDLMRFSEELGIPYVYAPERKDGNRRTPPQFVRNKAFIPISDKKRKEIIGTIPRIIDQMSITFYMPDSYWETRHREQAEAIQFYDDLEGHLIGEQTFRLFEELRVGVYKLKPGAEAILDLTPRFVREILEAKETIQLEKIDSRKRIILNEKKKPIIESKEIYTFPQRNLMEIEELESEEDEPKVVYNTTGTDQVYTVESLKPLHYQKIRTIGKEFGLDIQGRSGDWIINEIVRVQDERKD